MSYLGEDFTQFSTVRCALAFERNHEGEDQILMRINDGDVPQQKKRRPKAARNWKTSSVLVLGPFAMTFRLSVAKTSEPSAP